ncbi:hypothetical protein OGATHE_003699 [Ogataea polymorpha]|uniref:Uncharacterized protein n=1 Tax=Ogataea polymorpha TaxID=460523 RepID=A0A9P8P4H8_9ASCO|nr:hypothetical protein OGATHE_003699 [Ogataea polymorpha]
MVLQGTDTGLGNDGANFTCGSTNTMRGRSVSGWEALTRNNEGGGIWTEVLEELGKNIERKKSLVSKFVVGESDNTEDAGQKEERNKLQAFSSNGVDGGNREPVAWNGTGTNKDQVTGSLVVKRVVDVFGGRVANGLQNGSGIQTQAVVSNIQHEPRTNSTNEDLHVLPFGKVTKEVLGSGFWRSQFLVLVQSLLGLLKDLDIAPACVSVLTRGKLGNVGSGLFELSGHVESESWGLWDCQSEVQRNHTGHTAESNKNSPHLVARLDTVSSAAGSRLGDNQIVLVSDNTDESHETGQQLAPTLVGENSTHDGSSPSSGRKLGRDDGTERIITTDADTLDDSVECENSRERNSLRLAKGTLQNGSNNHDDQLCAVNLLSSHQVCKQSETELSNDCTHRGGHFQKSVGGGRHGATPVNIRHHGDS